MLQQALDAESRRDYLEAFRLALSALQADAADAHAMALLARLCMLAGDDAAALEFAGGANARGARAEREFRDAFSRVAAPLDDHAHAPGSLAPFRGMDVVERYLRERNERGDAARIANAQLRREHYDDALEWYRRAAAEQPERAELHLAVAELASMLGHFGEARDEFDRAFSTRVLFQTVRREPGALRVASLNARRPWSDNTPLDFIVDAGRVAIDRWYPGAAQLQDVASCGYDAVFNALGAFESNVPLLQALERSGMATINDPARIMATGRSRLADTLRGIPGVRANETRRIAAADVPHEPLPFLVRPPETHAGRGLARLTEAAEAVDYLRTHVDDEYDVCPYVDYARDGLYRKYRAVLIGGRAYPYHLAISRNWMVHYVNSDMSGEASHREEEAWFLSDPASAIPQWDTRLPAVAAALGLDYVGLDLTVLANGTLFVFEADPVMLVHAHEPDVRFAYRLPAVARITEALTELFQNSGA